MKERDLLADLELCERATDGPWVADVEEYPGNENLRYWIKTLDDGIACAATYDDAKFVAEAREGWPYAIKRAMEAEKKAAEFAHTIAELESEIKHLRYVAKSWFDKAMKFEYEKEHEHTRLKRALKNMDRLKEEGTRGCEK